LAGPGDGLLAGTHAIRVQLRPLAPARGLFTFLTQRRYDYPGAGNSAILYFIAAGILALAVGVETYFQNERWPRIAALAVIGATVLSIVLMVGLTLPSPGYALDPTTEMPVAVLSLAASAC
jgi:hypothetical protein